MSFHVRLTPNEHELNICIYVVQLNAHLTVSCALIVQLNYMYIHFLITELLIYLLITWALITDPTGRVEPSSRGQLWAGRATVGALSRTAT